MADENLEDPADYEEEEEDLQVGDKVRSLPKSFGER
jgi:hypothetical protein